MFNAVNRVESQSWDGRDTIVVASDVAVHKEAPSRPTGGAGCVGIAHGPRRAACAGPRAPRNIHDACAVGFYEPGLKVRDPLVNGHESIVCYLSALDDSFPECVRARIGRSVSDGNDVKNLYMFDRLTFHTSDRKLVSKSYGRLSHNDYLAAHEDDAWGGRGMPPELQSLEREDSLSIKELSKALVVKLEVFYVQVRGGAL